MVARVNRAKRRKKRKYLARRDHAALKAQPKRFRKADTGNFIASLAVGHNPGRRFRHAFCALFAVRQTKTVSPFFKRFISLLARGKERTMARMGAGGLTQFLDEIDLAILHELQTDGRMTNVELARRVGISAPPCLRRVRALEEAGVIAGYRALVSPAALGFEVVFFAFVQLGSQSGADLAAFEAQTAHWPVVRECWQLSGETDFLLKCVTRDLKSFQNFVSELTQAANVRNVRTSLALHASKDEALAPINRGD
jgi:DNA-binding Lrp family transcriptional regulator